MQQIIDIDKWLFLKINRQSVNPFFDWLMPFLREPMLWLPLYIFLIVFVLSNLKKGSAGLWILYCSVTVMLTDLISSHFFKPLIGRPRPCADVDLSEYVRLLAPYCGSNGSFTSSHAANHFGMAIFIYLTLRNVLGKWSYLFFVWAAVICYAQVYVGIHYPLDVLGGAVLGCAIGWMATEFLKKTTFNTEII